MAFRLQKPPLHVPAKQRRPKDAEYLTWLHSGLVCVVSGSFPIEAAHLSTPNAFYGHTGRGKGQKAGDRWCLPLSPHEHRRQHSMSEKEYWQAADINPWPLALTLYGVFLDGHDASFANQIIAMHRSGI